MLRSHIHPPVATAQAQIASANLARIIDAQVMQQAKATQLSEAQAHAADMAYHRAKVEDPYRQRQADRMAARENELRAATGQTA